MKSKRRKMFHLTRKQTVTLLGVLCVGICVIGILLHEGLLSLRQDKLAVAYTGPDGVYPTSSADGNLVTSAIRTSPIPRESIVEEAPPNHWTLQGQVRFESGSPLVRPQLTLWTASGERLIANGDSAGFYSIVLKDEPITEVLVRSSTLIVGSDLPRPPNPPLIGERIVVQDYVITDPVTIRGRVIDNDGRPVHGLKFTAEKMLDTFNMGSGYFATDAEGYFCIRFCAWGAMQVRMEPRVRDYIMETLPQLQMPRGGEVDVGVFHLAAFGSVKLTFVDSTNLEPIEGLHIGVVCPARNTVLKPDKSDAAGNVSFDYPAGRRLFDIIVGGYRPVPDDVVIDVPPRGVFEFTWRLRRQWIEGPMQVLVQDRLGCPLTGALVRWGGEEQTTGTEGYVTLHIEGQQTSRFSITHPDCDPVIYESFGLGGFPVRVFTLERRGAFLCRVTDAENRPAPLVNVTLFVEKRGSPEPWYWPAHRDILRNPRGVHGLKFGQLSENCRLQFVAPGVGWAVFHVPSGAGAVSRDEHLIELERLERVRGHVVDEWGCGIAFAKVFSDSDTLPSERQRLGYGCIDNCETAPDGSFELAGPANNGRVSVTINKNFRAELKYSSHRAIHTITVRNR